MGKYDKLIKDGLKIAQEWQNLSARYQNQFLTAKKNNIALEKSVIKDLTKKVEGNGDMAEVLREVETSRQLLLQNEEALQRAFKEHFDFVRGKPREGSVAICKMLKLKPNTEEWDEVLEGLKRALIDNTKQFAATEATWTKDVEPQLKLLKSRLDTLESIAKGQAKQNDAYLKQFLASKDEFKKMSKDIVVQLKTSQAIDDLKAMDDPNFMQGITKALVGKLQTYELRVTSIPKLRALVEKNFNRIMKSVPGDYRDKPMWSRAVRTLKSDLESVVKELDFAEKAFGSAAKKFKEKFPHI